MGVKKILASTMLIGLAFSTTSAMAEVKIEPDAIIHEKLQNVVQSAMGMIKTHGYRCDSISSATPFVESRGFTIGCNQSADLYDVTYSAGSWLVSRHKSDTSEPSANN